MCNEDEEIINSWCPADETESWLDSHPEAFREYFLKRGDLPLVNEWLSRRGYPVVVIGEGTAAAAVAAAEENGFQQQNQQRWDYARSKSRSFVQSCDSAEDVASRRSSLKELRKYVSLPPNSIRTLTLLIESKVYLPRTRYEDGNGNINSRRNSHFRRPKGGGVGVGVGVGREREFFLNLVRDISRELDMTTLSKVAVRNLAALADANGSALFIVHERAPPMGNDLIDSNGRIIPWGTGILGYVAETGRSVNLKEASEDPRFNEEADRVRGCRTDCLLCMPVKNSRDEIIAVAQVADKNDPRQSYFTADDEHMFETYLQFLGIALTNAKIVRDSKEEFEQNRNLLEVVHDLFEEQTSLEKVIVKIMQRARKLLKCEKAAVLLLDENSEVIKFSNLYELDSQISGNGNNNNVKNGRRKSVEDLSKFLTNLAERVAESGEAVNIGTEALTGSPAAPPDDENRTKCILAMPIRNKNYEIIGVASIINKLNGGNFDDNDERLFEAFTIFCGLGIHNTLMYHEIEKYAARQKVSIEVLSYHVSAPSKEVEQFLKYNLPRGDEMNIYSLSFDDFSLNENEMLLASVQMFQDLGLVEVFNIEKETLYRFLLTVKRNYRDVPYHNWRHAFNVAQIMFSILISCDMKETFSDLEVLGMFVGCLCHDLDHRGTNNAFQQKAGSALVLLYGNQNTMEHHHFNQAAMILSTENLNIFSSLSAENYSYVMKILRHSILATDLSTFFQCKEEFFNLVNSEQYSWDREDHRTLLRGMLMTASDLAASTKPWSIQERVARLVTDEFFVQGDMERNELKLQPQALMDRERVHELPQLQMAWITDICLPLYESLGKMNPKLGAMAKGAAENVEKWATLITT